MRAASDDHECLLSEMVGYGTPNEPGSVTVGLVGTRTVMHAAELLVALVGAETSDQAAFEVEAEPGTGTVDFGDGLELAAEAVAAAVTDADARKLMGPRTGYPCC